ncbi:S8 family serine peptidase [Nakamurella sp. YIM 132087]|uniref:S8 family serine peptidase n=1 Tax=Nakamurella alba TaxID=2665158 RepID=A0A7K1FM07_9ACTN|nr:S8 family serine peptidase [Nakamurella alba]MTD15090.1 S8 family serine peptidase [Nakamurella alba]
MRSRTRRARLLSLAVCTVTLPGLLLAAAGTAAAAPPGGLDPVPVPDSVEIAEGNVLAPSLQGAEGTVEVSVSLSEKALATVVSDGATQTRALPTKAAQVARTTAVVAQQDQLVASAKSLGATELSRASVATNAVAVSVPAANLVALSKLPGVLSVKPVAKYETLDDPGGSGSLAQAADYIQATQVRNAGFDGTGVKVAVLDSGVDFTHEYLGGPGTEAAYEECYAGANAAPVGACADLFGPSAPKVKGGYDFVGETWPNTAEIPDPNPIDFEGHGTHVSDIIGGNSADGTHKGIAPGVDLYAVKVCSAVATSCSGPAILAGIDWALDPNGDGDISDAMDIVNLSLGSSYGQQEDDSTTAINNLVRAGVVAVISAGNSADRPFIVGSPSTAEGAISVAQTALPDDKLYTLTVNSPTIAGLPGNLIRNSKLQSWSPAPTAALTAPIAQPTQLLGCTAAEFAGFPAGSIALIKRGTCNASVKAQLAEAAGASAAILWNNVAGDPPDFSFGGGAEVTIPTFTISLANGQLLSDAAAAGPVSLTIDPAKTTSLTNSVVGTSSRGLAISGYRAKPDIGAPGAWLSAEVGTGSGQTNFGGTSGAAPVVSGAAALLIDKFPTATPAAIKSRLLNGASTANTTPDANANLYKTPISRVGAGEVRVAPAANAVGILRNTQAGAGNIGLGLPHLTKTTTWKVTAQLVNTGTTSKTYSLSASFREAADANRKALSVVAPSSVTVGPKKTQLVTVQLTIDPSKLQDWPFSHSAGSNGDGATFNGPEIDGWVTATSGAEKLHLGWTVLPKKSASVTAGPSSLRTTAGKGALTLTNSSTVAAGEVEVFGLTGTSPKQPKPAPGTPGSPGSNLALIDLAAAGVRDSVDEDVIQFAIAGQQRQALPLYPAGYEIDVDVDQDGTYDYAIFNSEASGFALTGQTLVVVADLATGAQAAYYYADADVDSSNVVYTAPLSALGLEAGDTFDFDVLAYDNYYSGVVTDVILGQTWTVDDPKFALTSGAASVTVPAGGKGAVQVSKNDAAGETTSTGLLLLYPGAATRDYQAVPVN